MDEDQRQGPPSQGQGAMGTLTVCMLWALPARLSGPGGWAQAYVSSLTFHPSAQMFQNLFAAQTQSPPPRWAASSSPPESPRDPAQSRGGMEDTEVQGEGFRPSHHLTR